jgi:uncharacterized protein (DUF4415 family)
MRVRIPGSSRAEGSLSELESLNNLTDEDIDFSDIPATTENDWKDAVRGPLLPLEKRTVTLALDAEVFEWLQREATNSAFLINFVLKREAQRVARRREKASDSST